VPGATIIEKSVIWDDVNIGAGCRIDASIICNNCDIGDNVVLHNVIVGPNSRISNDTQIRDKTLDLGTDI